MYIQWKINMYIQWKIKMYNQGQHANETENGHFDRPY